MLCLQNRLAYINFSNAVSYERKMFMKLTPGVQAILAPVFKNIFMSLKSKYCSISQLGTVLDMHCLPD